MSFVRLRGLPIDYSETQVKVVRMKQNWNPDFHARLNAVLAVRRIKKSDLAASLGVSKAFVSLMCRGAKTPGKPVTILLRGRLGEADWSYLTAQTDTLPTGGE